MWPSHSYGQSGNNQEHKHSNNNTRNCIDSRREMMRIIYVLETFKGITRGAEILVVVIVRAFVITLHGSSANEKYAALAKLLKCMMTVKTRTIMLRNPTG